MDQHFDDLLAANRSYADSFDLQGFDGIAKAGVMLVTCMDSRIEPLGMLGLRPGDAKILRNPGGRVDDRALVALVLGNNLLGVDRILIVEHTRCAVASNDEETILTRVGESAGQDAHWLPIDPIADQRRALAADVQKVTSHPLIADSVHVGGFLYDVDTGLLERVA